MAKNVFLSFAMEDKTLVDLFRGQAKNENLDLEFNDHSVKEPFESAWKTNVRDKISRCSTVVCLIGHNTWESDAVKWEVEEAIRQQRKVIAVKLKPTVFLVPLFITNNSIKVLEWNLTDIMRELK